MSPRIGGRIREMVMGFPTISMMDVATVGPAVPGPLVMEVKANPVFAGSGGRYFLMTEQRR